METKKDKAKGPQPREGAVRRMEDLDLQSVIERAQGQDAEALGEIHHRYVRRVFGLCRYMLDSRESAEDATNEVFLKLQRSIASYDGSIPFPRWLLRVTGNQCIDVLRRRRREHQVMVEGEDEAVEATSSEPSPLNKVIRMAEREHVQAAIARLPENYRVPLVLRYYSELTYDEIGQQLGLQKNHVAALIFRAKQELRRRLAHGSK
jgi:RNA polymerase sigma-70 factor (ECF subfamily)